MEHKAMSRGQLSIKCKGSNGVTTMTLEGAIDASNVADFEKALFKEAAKDTPRIHLDCSKLTHLNSASFSLLVRIHKKCEQNQGALALSGLPKKMRNIIQLLGLDKILTIHSRPKAALKSLEAL